MKGGVYRILTNEPGDYILWALNHPTEFENTYNGTLKKLVRGR